MITNSLSFCFAFLVECGRRLHHLSLRQQRNTDGTESTAALYIELQLERVYMACKGHASWLLYQNDTTNNN